MFLSPQLQPMYLLWHLALLKKLKEWIAAQGHLLWWMQWIFQLFLGPWYSAVRFQRSICRLLASPYSKYLSTLSHLSAEGQKCETNATSMRARIYRNWFNEGRFAHGQWRGICYQCTLKTVMRIVAFSLDHLSILLCFSGFLSSLLYHIQCGLVNEWKNFAHVRHSYIYKPNPVH